MKTWTEKHLQELKANGSIRDYSYPKVTDPKPGGRKVSKHFPARSKGKDFIGWNLLYWCNERAVILEQEYVFNPNRKWRFDWAIPSLMLAIEYEGLMSEKSGHTTIKGFTGDTDKYNSAVSRGWTVVRVTALNYKSLLSVLNSVHPPGK